MKKKPASSAAKTDGTIEVSAARGCLTVTLNRPARKNRLTPEMADEMTAVIESAEDDDQVRMLAITGAGPVFCAGFEDGVNPNLVESFAILSKPTVAILNGDAIDEGLELAMAADIRVAVEGAAFALTQAARGAMPHFGGTQRLPRLVGAANALRMLLAGIRIDGAEAMRIGLVTYLAADKSELATRSGEVAQAILSRGPIAARLVKDAVRKGFDMTLEQGIRLEEDLYALLQTTADRAEGVRAFLEKRKPLFRGA